MRRRLTVALALALAAFVAACGSPPHFDQAVRMIGTSMVPTLDDQQLVGVRAPATASDITRGSVVVINIGGSSTWIKRVIALPGDHVEIVPKYLGKGGPPAYAAILIKPGGSGDSQVVNEPYLPDHSKSPWLVVRATCCDTQGRLSPSPTESVVSGYWLLGDNRNASKDSRDVGFITFSSIVGIVVGKIGSDGNVDSTDLGSPSLSPA